MKPYTQQRLTYTDDGRLLDENGYSVMMEWERPLMKKHAELISGEGKDVLNVGFGMGIIDSYIQEHNPNTHTIIELHNDVIFKLLTDGWLHKRNVIPLFGDWRSFLPYLPKYDGINIDTWDEEIDDFLRYAPNLLKPGGRLTYFNNLKGKVTESKIAEHHEELIFELYDVEIHELEIPHVDDNFIHGGAYWWPEWTTYYCPVLTVKPS